MARANNFDAVRLIAAIAVVFSHAFLIGEGTDRNEPLVVLSGNQCILGLPAVFVFFTISGFLVTQSFLATPSSARFVLKRILRIFPGLVVSILVCALVLGPLVTSLPLADYFRDRRLLDFLARNLALELGDPALPGVKFSDYQAGAVVNGSLWTLRYEVMMYALVLVLGWLRLLRLPVALGLLVLGGFAIGFERDLDPLGDLGEFAWMLGFFAAGMALYFLQASALMRWEVALAAGPGLAVATSLHVLILSFAALGGFLAIYLALKHTPALDVLSRYGDLSYGVYIYGWPVAQGVVYALGGAAPWWQVFLYSLGISLALAWLSWHGVEKWCLRLARRGGSPSARLQPATLRP